MMEYMNQNANKTEQDSALNKAYMELGKAYYEGKFEDPLPQLLPLFDKITRLKNAPKPKLKFCTQCGNKLIEGEKFCRQCGRQVM